MTTDPYDWSIAQVISEIAADDPALSSSLQANEVDGEVLLTVCTYERLKDDIGIIPLGKRSKIMRIIEGLRRRSGRYMEYVLDLASSVTLPDDVVGYSPRPIRALGVEGWESVNPRKRKSGVLLASPLRGGTPEVVDVGVEPMVGVKRRVKPLSLLAEGEDGLPLFVPESALHFANHSAVRIVRNRETGMGDTVPYSQERAESESGVEEMELDLEREESPPDSPTERLAGRGRVENRGDVAMVMSPEPLLVDEEDGDSRGVLSDDEPSAGGKKESPLKADTSEPKKIKGASRRHYLPVKGLTVDEVIYGKTEVGDEIHSEEEDGEFFMGNDLYSRAIGFTFYG